MNKKVLSMITIFMFMLISIPFVNGLSNSSLLAWWSWDTDARDLHGQYNGTPTGVTNVNGCKVDGCYYFDGANDWVTWGALNFSILSQTNVSINFWVNHSNTNTVSIYCEEGNIDAGNPYYRFGRRNGNQFNLWHRDQNPLGWQSSNYAVNVWHMITIVTNTTHVIYYENGTYVYSRTFGVTQNGDLMRWGVYHDDTQDFAGRLDEASVWNRTLAPSEMAEMWNNSFGASYDNLFGGAAPIPPGDNNSINITVTYPTSGYQNNRTITPINATVSSKYSFNCSLYINGTINETSTGYPSGTAVIVRHNFTVSDGTEEDFLYSFYCYNNESEEYSTNKTLFVDTIQPIITFDNQFVLGNKYVSHSHNLTGWVHFFDGNLFSYNITINQALAYNQTGLSVSSYNQSISYNTTGMSLGTNNISASACDGHTTLSLEKEWEPVTDKTKKELKYNINDDLIKIYNKDKLGVTDLSTEKLFDRYSFSFTFDGSPDAEEVFIVESNNEIFVMEGTQYTGHLITGKYWIDFENEEGVKASVKKINKYKVEVTLKGLKGNKVDFYSVGELNCNSKSYSFFVYNYSWDYKIKVLERENITLSFNVTKVGGANINASLFFNGTQRSVNTGTDYGTYYNFVEIVTPPALNELFHNMTLQWQINYGGTLTNTSENILQVHKMAIDNCSVFTTEALNISLRDEENNSLINGTLSGYFSLTTNLTTFSRNYTLDPFDVGRTLKNYRVCLGYPFAEYELNATFEYDAANFTGPKLYSLSNYSLDNVSDNIDLLLTHDGSSIKLEVTDLNDNPVRDVLISVVRWNILTQTGVTTQIVTTDSDGVVYSIQKLNDYYFYILTYKGRVVLQTAPSVLVATSKKFRINLDEDYFEDYDTVRGSTGAITFNNNTKRFSFTFSDITGAIKQFCLELRRTGINNDVSLNDTCVYTSSGTINMVIPEDVGSNTYTATGYVVLNSNKFVLDSDTQQFDYRYKLYGKSGIFVSFFLVLVLSLIGVWSPVMAVLLSGLGTFIILVLGIFSIGWPVFVGFTVMLIITLYKLARGIS